MEINEKQLVGKGKVVGKLGQYEIKAMVTKGGYHIVGTTKKNGFETLGVGPHLAVARHIAGLRAPEIQWTQLNKADHVPPEFFQHLLPKYEALTDRFRHRHGDE